MIEGLPKAKRAYYEHYNKIQDYILIKELHESEDGWNISFMCKQLEISRPAYYKWLNSTPSQKQLEDERIVEKIKEIAESNNSLFGAMNMYYVLKNQYGFSCGHNRVYRLMCINNIKSVYRKKSKSTYVESTPEETAENILNRDFNADKPNEKWCTDVTEIKVPGTDEKLYISPIIDLYDNYPIALEVSLRNDAILANNALEAAHNKYPDANPLLHSDRGSAYTRTVYKNILESYGMIHSMSRVGRCIDNGPCESFQGRFKDILSILYPNIRSVEEMKSAIEGTLDYYINHCPQKRFNGKTCGQIREEALKTDNPVAYPIKQANRYIKYWKEIEEKQQRFIMKIQEETIQNHSQPNF